MPKYQLSIGAIILSILVPLAFAQAAYNDVSLTTDAVISTGGYSLTISGSTALVQTLEVGSSDFSITVATGSTMVVTSSDRKIFTVHGVTSAYYSQTCSDSVSTLTITVPSASEAVPTALITPTATTCSASVGSSVSGGSGSGGSVPVPAPVTTPVVIPVVVPTAVPVAVPSCPAGVICTPVALGSASVVLTKDLSRGDENADVKKLQEFLAMDKEIYPEGIASGFFGPATERAVKRFQAKYGISQVGRVGPITREKIEEVSKGTQVPATLNVPVSAIFTKALTKGIVDGDVISLQKILNSDPDTVVSSSGAGSPGNETDYFGSLTLSAVQKFQEKYNIASPGDPGYGFVGPMTRSKLNELAK